MKRFVLTTTALAVAIVMFAGLAYATVTPGLAGTFKMYADAGYTTCQLTDNAVVLEVIYVRHEDYPCVTAGQFMIDNHGYTATWISDSYLGNLAIGDSQTGLALSYGANVATPWPMVNITYFGSGTTPACSYLGMVPDPIEPDGIIAATDCQFLKHVAVGSILRINGDATCPYCGVPTQQTNWSKIKSMYK